MMKLLSVWLVFFSVLVFGTLGCSGTDSDLGGAETGADGTDASDGLDASSGVEAADGVDATAGLDASDGSDALGSDGVDASDGLDTADGADVSDGTDASEEISLPLEAPETIGGTRPAVVIAPDDYHPEKKWPLVVLLHGYSATGSVQNFYLGLSQRTTEDGFILVLPEGKKDLQGNQFWNATDFCCDFYQSGVDDVSYLLALLDEARQTMSIDSERVYFMGHSNGGFMSYRMACEASDQITAIVSLAGASWLDWENCAAEEPVAVLQIHGTLDPTILYKGDYSQQYQVGYPSAQESASMWAAHNQCTTGPKQGSAFDFESSVLGAETEPTLWGDCAGGATVEMWAIQGGGHIPSFLSGQFAERTLGFLLSHSKSAL